MLPFELDSFYLTLAIWKRGIWLGADIWTLSIVSREKQLQRWSIRALYRAWTALGSSTSCRRNLDNKLSMETHLFTSRNQPRKTPSLLAVIKKRSWVMLFQIHDLPKAEIMWLLLITDKEMESYYRIGESQKGDFSGSAHTKDEPTFSFPH